MSAYFVRTAIPRSGLDAEISQQFREYGVATVAEAQDKQGLVECDMRPIQMDRVVAGRAVTVLIPAGDNLMIHAAMEVCRPGDILVVSSFAPSIHGAFGELLALACKKRGVAAVVLDVGVRDTQAIRKLGLPVWARAIYAGGTVKNSPGWVNASITLAGVYVSPGDFVVADDDGVVVVPWQSLEKVRDQALTRVAKENETRKKIEAGILSIDFYNLRPLLAQLGVTYIDSFE